MRNLFIVITVLLLITSITAHAQWRSDTHDVYNALKKPADITIDGELDDDEGWEGVIESVTGTDGKPFCGVAFDAGGKEEVWEAHQGGTWDGPEDHETCFAIVWEADAVYLAVSVKDDDHLHAGGSIWEGDSIQLSVVPDGMREQNTNTFILWNVALHDGGNLAVGNEQTRGNPGLEADENVVIVRNEDEKETYYEFLFTPDHFGLNGSFEDGYEFGLGICVNDGDNNAAGQKGWSGWYPRAIVHGKQPELTGLVRLSADELAVEAKNKLTTTWGRLKSAK